MTILPRIPRPIGHNDKIFILRGWRMGLDTAAIAADLRAPEYQISQALAGIRDGRHLGCGNSTS